MNVKDREKKIVFMQKKITLNKNLLAGSNPISVQGEQMHR